MTALTPAQYCAKAHQEELARRAIEVIRAHMLERHDRRAWWCACGANCLNTEDGHAEHVAKALLGGEKEYGAAEAPEPVD